MKHHVHIDLKKLSLTAALLRLRQAMFEMSPNQVVKVEIDAPNEEQNIRAFCQMCRTPIDHHEKQAGVSTYMIHRLSESYFGKM